MHLGQDRGPDRRMTPLRPSLPHELLGQVHDPRPNPIRKHLPDEGEVLRGHAVFTVLFEREPDISEPPESIFIKAADRMRKGNEPAAQIDRMGAGNLPILAPVAIEDFSATSGWISALNEVRRRAGRPPSPPS